jgi:predicted small secreted protein
MKRKFLIPASLALAATVALLGACKATDTAGGAGQKAPQTAGKSPATGTTEVHADGVRRVGPAELKEMMDEGRVVVYDTRAKSAYEYEHIKGSLSMPHEEVESRAGELPKGKTLVFYCT